VSEAAGTPAKKPWAVSSMAKDTVNGYIADGCLSRGASVAYFTVFSLEPILIVVIAVAGFVFGDDAARGVVFTKLNGMMGPDAAGLVQSVIKSAANKRSGIIATVSSVVVLLITASGVFGELQTSLNAIWKADPNQAHSSRLMRQGRQSHVPRYRRATLLNVP
jgi:membrane protein